MEFKSRKIKHGKIGKKSLEFFARLLKYNKHIHIERAHCVSRRELRSGNLQQYTTLKMKFSIKDFFIFCAVIVIAKLLCYKDKEGTLKKASSLKDKNCYVYVDFSRETQLIR